MSLYSALYSGVSGLTAYSSALSAISDNITNVNTVGYKGTTTEFSTLVTESQTFSRYSAGGVRAIPRTLVSRQGLLQASSSPTDLSIDGAGFFVVRNSPTANGQGAVQFTRAGSFRPDAEGYLSNTSGNYLLGFPLQVDGSVTNTGNVTDLVPIRITELTGTAEATENIRIRANLQSSDPLIPSVVGGTYDVTSATNNVATGGVVPNFSRDIEVFDAQGGTHTVSVAFVKTATPNRWAVEVYAKPASEIVTGAGLTAGQLSRGTIAFNSDGSLDAANTTPALLNPLSVNWTNGASSSQIKLNLGSDGNVDGLTQFDSVSTVISTSVDGAVFGNVTGVSIDRSGIVTTLFDNGLTRDVFKLPVATFQNPDGLTRLQGNAYGVSDFSGRFALVDAGSGGGGTISPSTLEASTVDLAAEFTNLITTQRAFSASTKVITTVDEILAELNQVV